MSPFGYVARNKQRHGPYSTPQVQEFLANGTLLPDDMILQDGTQKWVPARTLNPRVSNRAEAKYPFAHLIKKRWVVTTSVAALALLSGFILALLTVRGSSTPREETTTVSVPVQETQNSSSSTELQQQLTASRAITEQAIAKQKTAEREAAALQSAKSSAEKQISTLRTQNDKIEKQLSNLMAEKDSAIDQAIAKQKVAEREAAALQSAKSFAEKQRTDAIAALEKEKVKRLAAEEDLTSRIRIADKVQTDSNRVLMEEIERRKAAEADLAKLKLRQEKDPLPVPEKQTRGKRPGLERLGWNTRECLLCKTKRTGGERLACSDPDGFGFCEKCAMKAAAYKPVRDAMFKGLPITPEEVKTGKPYLEAVKKVLPANAESNEDARGQARMIILNFSYWGMWNQWKDGWDFWATLNGK